MSTRIATLKQRACQLGMTSSAVGVTEALAGGDGIADQLLELLDVGEAATIVAGPEHGGADAHLEDAAGAGHERDLGDLRLERRQQLLGHPGRPQQPAALRAVLDLDARTRLHGHDPAYRGPRIDERGRDGPPPLSAARGGSPWR